MTGANLLGLKVKDRITGFQGTATGFVVYISGCNQVLINGEAKDGKTAESAWYDEQRIVVLPGEKIVLDNSRTPGADTAAPIR